MRGTKVKMWMNYSPNVVSVQEQFDTNTPSLSKKKSIYEMIKFRHNKIKPTDSVIPEAQKYKNKLVQ